MNELGNAALPGGRTEDAIALFRRSVEEHSRSANAWDRLADAYSAAGRWQDAVRASDRAVGRAAAFGQLGRVSFVEHNKRLRERLVAAPEGQLDELE